MYNLPTSISIDDRQFTITDNGDFRMVLDCFSALNDVELGEEYRILASLLIFYEDFTCLDELLQLDEETATTLVREMFLFFSCGQEDSQTSKNLKLVDWENDAQIITAAVNNVAKKEIRLEPYLHWWTFIGYYMSIGESVLATVVSIRNKILTGKKMEKWEKEFQRDNPQYFVWNHKSVEEQELDDLVMSMWNS